MCITQGVQGIVKYGIACRRIILMQDGSEVRNFVANIVQFTTNNCTLVNLLLILKYLSQKGAAMAGYEFEFVDQKVTVRSMEDNVYIGVDSFAEHIVVINRKPILYLGEIEGYEETGEEIRGGEERGKQVEVNMEREMEVEMNVNVEDQIERMVMQVELQKIDQIIQHNAQQLSKSHHEQPLQGTDGSKQSLHPRKQKQKQRQIKNAIQCVKVWRGIYQFSGHKISLMSAAKSMGISKKSLDDYFLQLRLGELYGFDFTKNINKGIGVLRAFIKEKSNKEMESKVPKSIRSFELVREFQELKGIMVTESKEEK